MEPTGMMQHEVLNDACTVLFYFAKSEQIQLIHNQVNVTSMYINYHKSGELFFTSTADAGAR